MPEVGTTDFTFKDYKNLQAETISIEDKEFYNAVEVFGEDVYKRQDKDGKKIFQNIPEHKDL